MQPRSVKIDNNNIKSINFRLPRIEKDSHEYQSRQNRQKMQQQQQNQRQNINNEMVIGKQNYNNNFSNNNNYDNNFKQEKDLNYKTSSKLEELVADSKNNKERDLLNQKRLNDNAFGNQDSDKSSNNNNNFKKQRLDN